MWWNAFSSNSEVKVDKEINNHENAKKIGHPAQWQVAVVRLSGRILATQPLDRI